MAEHLPEIARRYSVRAIAPGMTLHRIVQLEMTGRFVPNGTAMPMNACQILAPPAQGFVWRAETGTGLMHFSNNG